MLSIVHWYSKEYNKTLLLSTFIILCLLKLKKVKENILGRAKVLQSYGLSYAGKFSASLLPAVDGGMMVFSFWLYGSGKSNMRPHIISLPAVGPLPCEWSGVSGGNKLPISTTLTRNFASGNSELEKMRNAGILPLLVRYCIPWLRAEERGAMFSQPFHAESREKSLSGWAGRWEWKGRNRSGVKCHSLLMFLPCFNKSSWINVSSFAICS